MDRPSARRTLAVMLALEGVAHLIKRRYYDSLVPDVLEPVRREIDLATGSLHLAGSLAMFVPRMRTSGRWLNLPVQVAILVAAVDNVRHPGHIRRDRALLPELETLVAGARIPPRVAAIALIWWATRPALR
ncbi:MAG TPA: hypothetical protein VFU35_05430 [Jatrophihabitans sp.]|nr:hypothetical protein [Jatrophihabitans sp.]